MEFRKIPRMHQVLSKDPSALEFLMDPDGSNTDNSNETLKTLMITLKKILWSLGK